MYVKVQPDKFLILVSQDIFASVSQDAINGQPYEILIHSIICVREISTYIFSFNSNS